MPLPSPSRPPPPPPPPTRPEIAAEVQRGVTAYNAQDIAYYQSSLAPDAVYIADDGGIFVGKERVVGLFTRIFARTPKPKLEVSDVVTGGTGDVAWARFKWALVRHREGAPRHRDRDLRARGGRLARGVDPEYGGRPSDAARAVRRARPIPRPRLATIHNH